MPQRLHQCCAVSINDLSLKPLANAEDNRDAILNSVIYRRQSNPQCSFPAEAAARQYRQALTNRIARYSYLEQKP